MSQQPSIPAEKNTQKSEGEKCLSMYGWTGRRLWLDLTNKIYEIERLPLGYYKKWIGGRGLNAEILKSGVSENPLCFAAGALTGTFAPLAGRTIVHALFSQNGPPSNPLFPKEDHAILEDAFGPNMKYAGYDQIIVRGRSKTPVFIFINDDRIEFREAKHLRGESIKKTAIRIQEELGSPDLDMAVIGPAGESRLSFAALHSVIRPAIGGPGLGAVMGAKNLKALVIRGTKPVRIADPKKFTAACWKQREKLERPGGPAKAEADPAGPLKSKPVTCWACPVGCGHYAAIQEGAFESFHGSGPQDEAAPDADPRIARGDAAGLFLLYETAQDLGMDGKVAMDVIASLMDLSEKNETAQKKGKGISLPWGDVKKAASVLDMIARRRFPAPLLRKCLMHNAGEKAVDPCAGLHKTVQAGIETMRCMADAVGGCSHAAGFPAIRHLWRDVYAPLFIHATGMHFSEEDMRRAAKRILKAEKAARSGTGVQ